MNGQETASKRERYHTALGGLPVDGTLNLYALPVDATDDERALTDPRVDRGRPSDDPSDGESGVPEPPEDGGRRRSLERRGGARAVPATAARRPRSGPVDPSPGWDRGGPPSAGGRFRDPDPGPDRGGRQGIGVRGTSGGGGRLPREDGVDRTHRRRHRGRSRWDEGLHRRAGTAGPRAPRRVREEGAGHGEGAGLAHAAGTRCPGPHRGGPVHPADRESAAHVRADGRDPHREHLSEASGEDPPPGAVSSGRPGLGHPGVNYAERRMPQLFAWFIVLRLDANAHARRIWGAPAPSPNDRRHRGRRLPGRRRRAHAPDRGGT